MELEGQLNEGGGSQINDGVRPGETEPSPRPGC